VYTSIFSQSVTESVTTHHSAEPASSPILPGHPAKMHAPYHSKPCMWHFGTAKKTTPDFSPVTFYPLNTLNLIPADYKTSSLLQGRCTNIMSRTSASYEDISRLAWNSISMLSLLSRSSILVFTCSALCVFCADTFIIDCDFLCRVFEDWGNGGGGHWLVRMEWYPVGWLMCLPLLIFPCSTKSRSSLLALAHLGGPRKGQ